MRSPFYFRPPDYRYTLRSEMAYGWWTGVIRGDRQFLRGVEAVATFDRAGELLQVEEVEGYPVPAEWRDQPGASGRVSVPWAAELGFEECPIRVKRFWVPQKWLGIEDLPDILAEYFTDPERFLARGDVRPEDALAWKRSDQFVFHCGCDYWLNSRGDVESS
jgi:hypothetical protein